MKKLSCSYWAATVFAVVYLLHPGLLRACHPYPYSINMTSVEDGQTPLVHYDPIVEKTDDPKPTVVAVIIFFGIMLLTFGYIIYKLIQMLDKVIPPPEKKDPPPPQSPTNSPPITINPTTAPGPARADDHKMYADTNGNWKLQAYAITNYNYIDVCSSNKPLFEIFWSTGLLLSTNLTDWEDSHYRIDAYVSNPNLGGGVLYRYYHFDTNFYNAYYTTSFLATNAKATAYFDLTDKPYRPVQFFRLAPQ